MPKKGIFFFLNKDEANLAKTERKHEFSDDFRTNSARIRLKKLMKGAEIQDF